MSLNLNISLLLFIGAGAIVLTRSLLVGGESSVTDELIPVLLLSVSSLRLAAE